MKVIISDKGNSITVDIGVDAMVDPALLLPKRLYLKKGEDISEFPFSRKYNYADKCLHTPGGIPGGYFSQSNSQYRSKVSIDIKK